MQSKNLIGILLALALVLLVIFLGIKLFQNKTGFGLAGEKYTITSNGIERNYYVHTPKEYDKNTPTPVVIMLHGGGGSAEGQAKIINMGEASDTHGFIAVYPEGTRADGNPDKKIQRFWNAGTGPNGPFNTAPTVLAANDTQFVLDIIKKLEMDFRIDQKRIYVTGFSNGASMAHKIGCDLSTTVAAIAPVGAPYWGYPEDCTPVRPMPIIYFHGTDDKCAPYNGGISECEKGFAGGGRIFPSAENSVHFWKEKNNCNETGTITYQHGDVTCTTYSCEDNAEVEFCSIKGAGHTWPGGEGYSIPGIPIGNVTQDINANDEMWKFFEKHPLP